MHTMLGSMSGTKNLSGVHALPNIGEKPEIDGNANKFIYVPELSKKVNYLHVQFPSVDRSEWADGNVRTWLYPSDSESVFSQMESESEIEWQPRKVSFNSNVVVR